MSDEKNTEQRDPVAEVKAMGKVAEAVAGLDPEATARVLGWAVEFYRVPVGGSAGKKVTSVAGAGAEASPANGGSNGVQQFATLADLYDAASPESDADKTLVAGYWFQFGEGKAEFGAQEVNTALKNLGHPIKHITSAFDTLKVRKPAPVMQLKKSGSSKQARKTFKLTVAGKSTVELMIGQH